MNKVYVNNVLLARLFFQTLTTASPASPRA